MSPDSTAGWISLEPSDAGWHAAVVAAFRDAAGRRVRWLLRTEDRLRAYEGRVPAARRWRHPEEPFLMLPPGSTDGVHVLAEIELHLRLERGHFILARRKWYEHRDLDMTRLGGGPLEMTLEVIE